MEHTARNYHAHGGGEWVIGGKLTFLPGATVEGAEGLFDLPRGEERALPLHSRQRGGYGGCAPGGLQPPPGRSARSGHDGPGFGRR